MSGNIKRIVREHVKNSGFGVDMDVQLNNATTAEYTFIALVNCKYVLVLFNM